MSDTVEAEPMLLAAEYALGTLDLADMRRAEAIAAEDPGFAAEITYWQDRLSPLTGLVAPVAPPASLWPRLALATGIGGLAPEPRTRRSSRLWQGATAMSLALAASLALFAFLPRPPSAVPEQARFAAALAPLNSPAQFLAEARPDGSLTVTSLAAAPAPAGRAYELWGLPQGASAPVSLGVLPLGQRTIAPPVRPSAREQLLISDEPAGGSPTGAPTGPVLWGGTLVPVSPAAAPGR
jgi:anti-sigma-K factor RskA